MSAGIFASYLLASPASAMTAVKIAPSPVVAASVQAADMYFDSSVTVQTAQRMISASEAKSIARRRHPGSKYVGMSRKGKTYTVRVQKAGRILDVLIDATTGRVLN